MRRFSSLCITAALAASMLRLAFVVGSSMAASAPMGVIVEAKHATLGADVVLGGESVYDGDRLGTKVDGLLRARVGGSQIYLRRNTSAQVHSIRNGFSVDLTSGTVIVSSPAGQPFELVADGATIRPAGSDNTMAEVAWINPRQLVLTPSHGSVQISMKDEAKIIEPGNSYRIEVETADPASSGGPYYTASNHFIIVAIGGVAAGAIVGVWRGLVSPSAP